MKKIPVLASRERGAYGFWNSLSIPSACRTILRWEDAAINISLNNGSLKQLFPVSSNWWYRSNVRLTNAKAVCLAILLPELFPPEGPEPQQACQINIVNSLCHNIHDVQTAFSGMIAFTRQQDGTTLPKQFKSFQYNKEEYEKQPSFSY